MGLAVARVIAAQDVVATDYDEAAAEGAGLDLVADGIAHQKVASIGRDYQCVEGVSHKAG
jgi:hypothetical protein